MRNRVEAGSIPRFHEVENNIACVAIRAYCCSTGEQRVAET